MLKLRLHAGCKKNYGKKNRRFLTSYLNEGVDYVELIKS